jgi:hypothetical protein
MLLQRETSVVAIVTIEPGPLRGRALRPPDMIGEAAPLWQEAPVAAYMSIVAAA